MEIYNLQDLQSLVQVLNREFGSIENQVKKLQGSATDEQAIRVFWQKKVSSFIKSKKPELIGLSSTLEDILSSKQAELEDLQIRKASLMDSRRQHEENADWKRSKKGSYLYWGLYGSLIIGSMGLYALSFPLIMPEQNTVMAIISSLIMASPSYMIAKIYARRQDKNRFLSWLEGIGLTASVSAVVFIGLTRGLAYHVLGSSSASNSLLASTSSTSLIEKLVPIFGGVTFCAGMICEMAFGGRLLIQITRAREARIPLKQINAELEIIEPKIEFLQGECGSISQLLEQIESIDEICDFWGEAKVEELVLEHLMDQKKIRRKRIDDHKDRMEKLPLDELLSMPEAEEREKPEVEEREKEEIYND